ITICYTGEIVSGVTVVVSDIINENKNQFKVANEKFAFRVVGSDLVIEYYYNVIYHINADIDINVPIDENNYFSGESVGVVMLDKYIRENYIFLGWSEDCNSSNATYNAESDSFIINGNDVNLYAIWEAITYSIIYHNISGENLNPATYSVESEFFLIEPTKKFYKFIGWTNDEIVEPQKEVKIELGSIGDKEFYANWEVEEYRICYNGLTCDMIEALNLKTTYTILDDAINTDINSFLINGYSTYGVYYDRERELSASGNLYFKLNDIPKNNNNFVLSSNEIGKDINLYIDIVAYQNGKGDGTSEKPFEIESVKQFKVFLTGYKKRLDDIHIIITKDLNLSKIANDGAVLESLYGFNIDGENHCIYIDKFYNWRGYTGLIPSIINSKISNLKICSNKEIVISNNDRVLNLALIGYGENLTLENVVCDVDLKVVNKNSNAIKTLNVAGIVANLVGKNNVINNCNNLGDINMAVSNYGDVEIYGAGIVSNAYECLIVNTTNGGNFKLSVNNDVQNDSRVFIAGVSILNGNAKVVNSINCGNIECVQSNCGFSAMSGIAIAFNNNCSLNNVVN
ncbi:MAG: InlB B-repeat-containing protein, partial [Christensenellales bacterium]